MKKKTAGRREPTAGKSHHGPKAGSCVRRKPNLSEASVRLGHKSLRTLMKRSSSWYLPGGYQGPLHPSSSQSLRLNGSCVQPPLRGILWLDWSFILTSHPFQQSFHGISFLHQEKIRKGKDAMWEGVGREKRGCKRPTGH